MEGAKEVTGKNVDEEEAVSVETTKTIYHPDIAMEIKIQVNRVWNRIKDSRKLKQENLARALGTTQSAVSKLLNDDNGHPWTESYLRKFSEFCNVKPSEFIDRENIGILFEWEDNDDDFDDSFVEECILAIQNYLLARGIRASRVKLSKLAAKLATKLEGTKPDFETMEREIERVILEGALETG